MYWRLVCETVCPAVESELRELFAASRLHASSGLAGSPQALPEVAARTRSGSQQPVAQPVAGPVTHWDPQRTQKQAKSC